MPLIKCREPLVHRIPAAAVIAPSSPPTAASLLGADAGLAATMRPLRSYFVAANADTVQLAMYGAAVGDDPGALTAAPSSSAATHSLRLLLAAAACQFVEAKHGVHLQKDTWKLMVG